MENIKKTIRLLCPTCGNNQFESLDVSFEDLHDASGEVRVKCSDCGLIITKEELVKSNALVINNAIDETIDDVKKQIVKEINKVLK